MEHKKQTFLLQEVIDDLVNTDKSLSAPLTKLNCFGRLIKNQELTQQITFSQKMTIAYAAGILPHNFYSAVAALNKIRNNYAHSDSVLRN